MSQRLLPYLLSLILTFSFSIFWVDSSYGASGGQPTIPGVTGTFGTATQVGQFTVKDGKVTAASNVNIVLSAGAVTGAMLSTSNGLGANGQVLTTNGAGGLSWSDNVPGPKGDKGDTGDTGLQGPPGEQGPAGVSVVDGQGHVHYTGGTPTTLGQCPATIEGTDNGGTITFTNNVQTCSIFFSSDQDLPNEPSCVVSLSTPGVGIGVKTFVDRFEVSATNNFATNERLHFHCIFLD